MHQRKFTPEERRRSRVTDRIATEADQRRQIAELAGTIQDEAHLNQILDSADPAMRQAVLEQLRPHLRFTIKGEVLQ